MQGIKLSGFLLILVSLLIIWPPVGVFAGGETVNEESELVPVEPGFYGYPLKIFRVLEPEHPYPEVTGLYLTSADPESPPGQKRILEEVIITKIDGEPVNHMSQVREIVNQDPGKELRFEGYRLTPSYLKRRREDPFFDFRGRRPYRPYSVSVVYPREYVPDPQSVIVHEGGTLYHKGGFEHSPDTATGLVFESGEEAREAGYRPCPFCFPGSTGKAAGEQVADLVGQELPGGSGLMEDLEAEFGLIDPLPEELVRLRERIFPRRIRMDIEPQIIYLDTNIFYGFGMPGGEIIISRGLWEFLEFEKPRAFLLASLLGHCDFRNLPGLPGEEHLFGVLRRFLGQLTGQVSGLNLGHLESLEKLLPSYIRTLYSGLLEHGYSNDEETAAFFLGMVYLHRAELEMDSVDDYLVKARDIKQFPREGRLSYRNQRPIPRKVEELVKGWKKIIPRNFSPEAGEETDLG